MIRSMLFRDKKGFTLVELVVVVAILAILAGIAVPVYSGYIEKAHEAADLQLLDAMNTAFAAACAARGIDPRTISEDGIMIIPTPGEGNTIAGLSVIGPDGKYSGLNDDFITFFGDNANTPFQNYDVENITLQNGVFTAEENALAQRWVLSSFNNHEENLLVSLDKLSIAIGDSDGLTKLLGALESNNPEVAKLREAFGDYPQYIKRFENAQKRGDATVLFIAEQSAGRNTDEALQSALRTIDLLKEKTIQHDTQIREMQELLESLGQNSTVMEEMGLAYALVTGYYNYKNLPSPPSAGKSLWSTLELIQSTAQNEGEDFALYLQNRGRADISAYLSAMQVLKDNSDIVLSENAAEGETFKNLLSTLNALLGKG